MTGKQVFLIIMAVVLIIKDPQIISEIINGIIQFLSNGTGH